MYIADSYKLEIFKVSRGILALYMKLVNPQDEIKGSISTPRGKLAAATIRV
jgi:hypothetical protein